MRIKNNSLKPLLLLWLAVFLAIPTLAVLVVIRSRPVVLSYARTRAESIMVSAFDDAVKSAIERLRYDYSDMAVVTRGSDNAVKSIEINYAKLNILRAEISKTVYKTMAEKSDNQLHIPLGTLLGNEYTAGYGPSIKFNIKFVQIPRLNFESNFLSAGINNVFHQINGKKKISMQKEHLIKSNNHL